MERLKVTPHDETLLHETGSSVPKAHCTTLFHGVASVSSNVGYEGALLQWDRMQHYQLLSVTSGDFFLTVFSLLARVLNDIITLF